MHDPAKDPQLTRPSLLLRIRDAQDAQAWEEFHDLYAPLLYKYARARGLSHADAEDARAQCYEAIVKQIPTFDYDRQKGGFKAWLRTMVARRVIDRLRRQREKQLDTDALAAVADGEAHDEDWEQQWREEHLRFCVASARGRVTEETWTIFRSLVYDGLSVADISEQFDVTSNQIYKARSRMLQMIREKLEYLRADE